MWKKLQSFIFQNLIVGILSLLPFIATIYVFFAILNFSDNFLFNLLPENMRPKNLLGYQIPGLGIILTFTIILIAGLLTRNFLGKRLLGLSEKIITRIPVVRSIYKAFRQFLESIFTNRTDSFRKVVLIEYPRKGLHTLAFVTNAIANKDPKSPYKELYSIFVPTTPNPTSGFLLILPSTETLDTNITVQEAFHLIISGGVIFGTEKENFLKRLEKSIQSKLIS